MAKRWIQKMSLKKGALTEKADRAGETPMEFAREHEDAPGKTGKESRLTIAFSHMHKKKK